jgi:hypothetical protein
MLLALGSLAFIRRVSVDADKLFYNGVVCITRAEGETERLEYSDMRSARANYNGTITTEYLTKAYVSVYPVSVYASVSAVSPAYFETAFHSFLYGGPWENDYSRYAVVNEALAWKLFGSYEAAGLTLRANNENYIIAGVVSQGTLALALSGGEYYMWLPCREDDDNIFNIIYLKPFNYNRLSAYQGAAGLMKTMGYGEDEYAVADINAYNESISIRGGILYITMVWLAVFMFVRFIAGIYAKARREKRGWWFMALLAAAGIACAVIIIPTFSLDLWIPAFIRDDVNGYLNVIFNAGELRAANLPYTLETLRELNFCANAAFAAGIAGVLGLAFCEYKKGRA